MRKVCNRCNEIIKGSRSHLLLPGQVTLSLYLTSGSQCPGQHTVISQALWSSHMDLKTGGCAKPALPYTQLACLSKHRLLHNKQEILLINRQITTVLRSTGMQRHGGAGTEEEKGNRHAKEECKLQQAAL